MSFYDDTTFSEHFDSLVLKPKPCLYTMNPTEHNTTNNCTIMQYVRQIATSKPLYGDALLYQFAKNVAAFPCDLLPERQELFMLYAEAVEGLASPPNWNVDPHHSIQRTLKVVDFACADALISTTYSDSLSFENIKSVFAILFTSAVAKVWTRYAKIFVDTKVVPNIYHIASFQALSKLIAPMPLPVRLAGGLRDESYIDLHGVRSDFRFVLLMLQQTHAAFMTQFKNDHPPQASGLAEKLKLLKDYRSSELFLGLDAYKSVFIAETQMAFQDTVARFFGLGDVTDLAARLNKDPKTLGEEVNEFLNSVPLFSVANAAASGVQAAAKSASDFMDKIKGLWNGLWDSMSLVLPAILSILWTYIAYLNGGFVKFATAAIIMIGRIFNVTGLSSLIPASVMSWLFGGGPSPNDDPDIPLLVDDDVADPGNETFVVESSDEETVVAHAQPYKGEFEQGFDPDNPESMPGTYEAYEQSGGTFSICSNAMKRLLQFFVAGGMTFKTDIFSVVKNLPSAIKSVDELVKIILEFVLAMGENILPGFAVEFLTGSYGTIEVQDWFNVVRDVLDKRARSQLVIDRHLPITLKKLQDVGQTFILTGKKIGTEALNPLIAQLITRLQKLNEEIQPLTQSISHLRPRPVTILFTGVSGSGKSNLGVQIARELAYIEAKSTPERLAAYMAQPRNEIFWQGPDHFNDGMTSQQSVFIYDDWYQSNPVRGQESPPGATFIHMANDVPFTPRMAAVESKNTIFCNFKYMIYTSNLQKLADETALEIDAVGNRLDIICDVKRLMNHKSGKVFDPTAYILDEKRFLRRSGGQFEPTGTCLSPRDVLRKAFLKAEANEEYWRKSLDLKPGEIFGNWQTGLDERTAETEIDTILSMGTSYGGKISPVTPMVQIRPVEAENQMAWNDIPEIVRPVPRVHEREPPPLSGPEAIRPSSRAIAAHPPDVVRQSAEQAIQSAFSVSIYSGYDDVTNPDYLAKYCEWLDSESGYDHNRIFEVKFGNAYHKDAYENLMKCYPKLWNMSPGQYFYFLSTTTVPIGVVVYGSQPTYWQEAIGLARKGVDLSKTTYGKVASGLRSMWEYLKGDEILITLLKSSVINILTSILTMVGIVGVMKLITPKKKKKGGGGGPPPSASNQISDPTSHSSVKSRREKTNKQSRQTMRDLKDLRAQNPSENQGVFNDATALFRKNILEVWTADQSGDVQSGYALALFSRVFIMPLHYLTKVLKFNMDKTPPDIEGVWFELRQEGFPPIRFNAVREMTTHFADETGNSDLLVFSPTVKCKEFRDITGHLLPDNDVYNVLFTASRNFTGTLIKPHETHSVAEGFGAAQVWVKDANEIRQNLLGYRIETIKGDCGLPMILSSGKNAGKLVGIHVCGNGTYGFASPFSRALIKRCVTSYVSAPENVAIEVPDVVLNPDPPVVHSNFDFHGDVQADYVTRNLEPPSGTHIKNELVPFHGDGPEYFERLTMASNVSPKLFAANRALFGAHEAVVGDWEVAERLAVHATRHFHRLAPQVIMKAKSFKEAILGTDEHMGRMDTTTSTGHPDTALGIKRTDYWKFDQSGSIVPGPMFQDLYRDVEDDLNLLMNGGVPMWMMKDVEKGERIKIHKYESGLVRFVNAPPVRMHIVVRMAFGAAMEVMAAGAPRNGILKGIDEKKAYHWNVCANQLRQVSNGKFCGSGDFKGFDHSHRRRMCKLGVKIMADMYEFDPVWTPIREGIIKWFDCQYHVFGSVVELYDGGMPSGFPLTTETNCGINYVLFLYAYVKMESMKVGVEVEFDDFVALFILGDDNIFSVHESIKDQFTEKWVAESVADFGYTYTAPDKSPARSVLTPMENHAILKRGFRYEQAFGMWVGPLDLNVVLEIPLWSRRGLEYEKIGQQNIETALRELVLHGKDVFDEWKPKLKAFAGKFWDPVSEDWWTLFNIVSA